MVNSWIGAQYIGGDFGRYHKIRAAIGAGASGHGL
jgi:hypothetical protein